MFGLFSSRRQRRPAAEPVALDPIRVAVRAVLSDEADAAERLATVLLDLDQQRDEATAARALALLAAAPRTVLRLDQTARSP